MFNDPWRALANPALALVWAPGVSRLFQHEKLARPSDTGHYVVTTRLFQHLLGQMGRGAGPEIQPRRLVYSG